MFGRVTAMGQGASGEAAVALPDITDALNAVEAELNAGLRAYDALRSFVKLLDMMEKPNECDLARKGWVQFCRRLQRTARAANGLFDGGRTEELGLAHLRSLGDARTTYSINTFTGKSWLSPAAAVEDALRGLHGWVDKFVDSVRLRAPPGRCLRTVEGLVRTLADIMTDSYWARFVRPALEKSIENLAEGIAIFVEAISCITEEEVEVPEEPTRKRVVMSKATDLIRSQLGDQWYDDIARRDWKADASRATNAAWSSAKGLVRSSGAIVGSALKQSGSGLLSLAKDAPSAVSTAYAGTMEARRRRAELAAAIDEGERRAERIDAILAEYKIDRDDSDSDPEEFCRKAATKPGAIAALRAEGACLDASVPLEGGDSPELLGRVRRCKRKIYIQERRSTPMNLDLLHDLFDIIEEGFALDAPDRDIKREAKDTLADVEGIVPTEAKYVERPAPVSPPGSRMRFR